MGGCRTEAGVGCELSHPDVCGSVSVDLCERFEEAQASDYGVNGLRRSHGSITMEGMSEICSTMRNI
jgi:hypothetical protein